jgi:hypothetical protein
LRRGFFIARNNPEKKVENSYTFSFLPARICYTFFSGAGNSPPKRRKQMTTNELINEAKKAATLTNDDPTSGRCGDSSTFGNIRCNAVARGDNKSRIDFTDLTGSGCGIISKKAVKQLLG